MNKLYIVGMPIGNIRDITLRALDTIKNTSYIACEDTRKTKKILNKYNLNHKKLIVYNDHNEKKKAIKIIEIIKQGASVVQVTDAGMPFISDPGYVIINLAIKENIKIEIVPGPSAVTMTSVLANFDPYFTFHGFLKYKKEQRKKQLLELPSGTHIFFVSPHKIAKELDDIKNVLGPDTNIFIGRELTKKFETHYRGNVKTVIEKLDSNFKGEFTMAIKI